MIHLILVSNNSLGQIKHFKIYSNSLKSVTKSRVHTLNEKLGFKGALLDGHHDQAVAPSENTKFAKNL